MASIMYTVKCPCCGRIAGEDYYYKTEEKYIYCSRCGYNYSKTTVYDSNDNWEYREGRQGGHGVFILETKDGARKHIRLNSSLTDQQLEEYTMLFMDDSINQKKSYLVSFRDGVFTVLLGNPPENFHLSFEEYREKYGDSEFEFILF